MRYTNQGGTSSQPDSGGYHDARSAFDERASRTKSPSTSSHGGTDIFGSSGIPDFSAGRGARRTTSSHDIERYSEPESQVRSYSTASSRRGPVGIRHQHQSNVFSALGRIHWSVVFKIILYILIVLSVLYLVTLIWSMREIILYVILMIAITIFVFKKLLFP